MISQRELGGIPVLSVPHGPVAAGISFRVGYADEQLARSGITHLIEHLALHRLGTTDYHVNGATLPFVTSFYSHGSAATARTYLEQVCQALVNLPMERLELEKDVLRTEADGTPAALGDRCWLWRHGSRGAGLAGYREVGLPEITAHDVAAWSAWFFNRDNAVLWFTGMPVPDALDLALPAGGRRPLPVSPDILPQLPAFFADQDGRVGYEVRVPRTSAATQYSRVLERELFRGLRQHGGLSYQVATSYEPVCADTAAIFAVADAAEGMESAVLGEFLDVLARLRWRGPDPADVAGLKEQDAAKLADPLAEAAGLPGAARDLLFGQPVRSSADLAAELHAVTPGDVHQVAQTSWSSGLLMVPAGLDAEWAGFVAAPAWSASPMPGQALPGHNAPGKQLVIGPDGVSHSEDGRHASVRFDDCEAMLAWPDGARVLIGGDAVSCPVEPTLFPLDAHAIAYLDQRVPPQRVVRMPPRRPDAIPSPPQPSPTERRRSPVARLWGRS